MPGIETRFYGVANHLLPVNWLKQILMGFEIQLHTVLFSRIE
jgi:hypothetical protein